MRHFLLAPALVALSGCISLGPEPPEALLTLEAATPFASTADIVATPASALYIAEPEADARLGVTRVPVQVSDTEIAYLQDATWVERPARLFRRLLAETIRARGGRMVVESFDAGVLPEDTVRGTLRAFGYDARTSEVVVTFDAVRSGADAAMRTRRFEARVPGVVAEAGPVGVALNQAANEVARDVADWVG